MKRSGRWKRPCSGANNRGPDRGSTAPAAADGQTAAPDRPGAAHDDLRTTPAGSRFRVVGPTGRPQRGRSGQGGSAGQAGTRSLQQGPNPGGASRRPGLQFPRPRTSASPPSTATRTRRDAPSHSIGGGPAYACSDSSRSRSRYPPKWPGTRRVGGYAPGQNPVPVNQKSSSAVSPSALDGGRRAAHVAADPVSCLDGSTGPELSLLLTQSKSAKPSTAQCTRSQMGLCCLRGTRHPTVVLSGATT